MFFGNCVIHQCLLFKYSPPLIGSLIITRTSNFYTLDEVFKLHISTEDNFENIINIYPKQLSKMFGTVKCRCLENDRLVLICWQNFN